MSTQRVLLLVLLFGAAVGYIWPNPKLAPPWNAVQSGLGWTYTVAWGLSFIPQVVLNFRRRNVTGLSFDFLALNFLGWLAYATFNVTIFFAFECPPAQPQAPAPRPGRRRLAGGAVRQPSTTDFCQYAVELNDVVFALHALAMTSITVVQCCVYPRGKQRVHALVALFMVSSAGAAAGYGAAIFWSWDLGQQLAPFMKWVYWLYFLSFIKMIVTVSKYIPQVLYNYRRKSTQGWSILNVLLDLMGGVLSMGQQLLTCYWAGSWTPVTANPVKLGLGIASILFDLVFMLQHYVLYAEKRRPGPCPLSLRRVRSLLRALSRAPERLPPDIAEDLLLSLSDAGFDVDVPRVLKYYSDHPEDLPQEALENCLAAYWRVGGAVGIARGFNLTPSYTDLEAAAAAAAVSGLGGGASWMDADLLTPRGYEGGGGGGYEFGVGGSFGGGGSARSFRGFDFSRDFTMGGTGGGGGGGGGAGPWFGGDAGAGEDDARLPLLASDFFRPPRGAFTPEQSPRAPVDFGALAAAQLAAEAAAAAAPSAPGSDAGEGAGWRGSPGAPVSVPGSPAAPCSSRGSPRSDAGHS